MNQNIQDNLVKLLDAYLEDLKTEADTVTHIVNYINDSTTARAALAEQLESHFWMRTNQPASTDASAGNLKGKADALLRNFAGVNGT